MSATAFAVYAVSEKLNVPLILQPHLFGSLCLISWGQVRNCNAFYSLTFPVKLRQCQYYGNKHSKFKSIMMAAFTAALLGGLEIGMIFVVRVLPFTLSFSRFHTPPCFSIHSKSDTNYPQGFSVY